MAMTIMIRTNIEKNKLSNIITLNIAISNKKGKRIDDIVEKNTNLIE